MGSRFPFWLLVVADRAVRVGRADQVALEAIAGRVGGGDAADDGRGVQVVLRRAGGIAS
jgi:hypothetical protein